MIKFFLGCLHLLRLSLSQTISREKREGERETELEWVLSKHSWFYFCCCLIRIFEQKTQIQI